MDPMRSGPRNGSNPVFAVGGKAIAWAAVGAETSAGHGQVGKMTKSAIWDCISGFCGVETNVPLILTQVNKGRMTLNHYVKVQSENVAKVWQMYPKKGAMRLGSDGDLTIADMNKEGTIDPRKLHSKNHPTPWGGWKIKGMPVYTIVRGNVQMKDGEPVGGVIGQMQTPIIN